MKIQILLHNVIHTLFINPQFDEYIPFSSSVIAIYFYHSVFCSFTRNIVSLITENIYFLTDLGGLCSDSTAQPLYDEGSCRTALAQIKQHDITEGFQKFYRKENTYFFPKGCYTTPLDVGVHFNSDLDGDRHPMARQICTSGHQTIFIVSKQLLNILFLQEFMYI